MTFTKAQKWVIGTIAAGVLIITLGALGSDHSNPRSSALVTDPKVSSFSPAPAPSSAPKPVQADAPLPSSVQAPPAPASIQIADGVYEVGSELGPGKYKTPGGSGSCYYARLKGDDHDIIVNGYSAGPQTVVVKATDSYLELSGGCTWTKS